MSPRDVPEWEQWRKLTYGQKHDFRAFAIRVGGGVAADVVAYIDEVEARQGRWRRYKRHLQSRYWRALREQAKQRSDGCCERCGRRGTGRQDPDGVLHLHHLTYERLGHETLDDVELLCAACHREEHRVPS